MKLAAPGISLLLAAVLFAAALPTGSDARTKRCKTPWGATVVERSPRAVIYSPPSGKPRRELITFYGCARGVGKRFFVWKCDPGQITSDRWLSVRVKNKVAILEILRRTEESPIYFHLTRRVSLRSGTRRDIRRDPKPLPPESPHLFEC